MEYKKYPIGSIVACQHCDTPLFKLKKVMEELELVLPKDLDPIPPMLPIVPGQLMECWNCKGIFDYSNIKPPTE